MNLLQRLLDLSTAVKFNPSLLEASLLSTAVAAGSPYSLMARLLNDLAMAQASRDPLLAGKAIAMLLTRAPGLIFATRLSRRLKRLTRALSAREHGELRPPVIMGANDEIGQLAYEFNQRSGTLAARDQPLRDSREQIQRHAERLHALSMADALTGLCNRGYFDEQGALLLKRRARQPAAVCDHWGYRPLQESQRHLIPRDT